MTTIRAVPKTYAMSPSEGAAIWAARLDRGMLTHSEEAELAEWLADAKNDEALGRATDALHVFDADRLNDPHLRALRQAALETAPMPYRRHPMYLAASVAAIGIAVALLMGRIDRLNPAQAPVLAAASATAPSTRAATTAKAPAAPVEYASAVGKRRTVELSDGSTITLNTNSEVAVNFTEGARLIHLVRGQALFDVAHNPQKPFMVFAAGRRVTALGTVFEVRAEPRRMQVVLARGSVVIDGASQLENSANAKGSAPALLTPGQAFIAEGGRQRVVSIDVKRELLWRSGFVEFDDESLAHAVAEINRYTTRPIVLSPDGVADLHVSGVFRTDDPKHFVETISEVLSIDTQSTQEGGIRLSRAKKTEL